MTKATVATRRRPLSDNLYLDLFDLSGWIVGQLKRQTIDRENTDRAVREWAEENYLNEPTQNRFYASFYNDNLAPECPKTTDLTCKLVLEWPGKFGLFAPKTETVELPAVNINERFFDDRKVAKLSDTLMEITELASEIGVCDRTTGYLRGRGVTPVELSWTVKVMRHADAKTIKQLVAELAAVLHG
jgi:hypothetical protein